MSALSYLKIIRPVNGLMSVVAVYIAALVVGVVSVSSLVPTLQLWIAMTTVFLISGAGMVINDVYDIEIDKVNKPKRSLPSGQISLKTAKIYAAVLFIAGIWLSYFINFYAIGVAILASFLLFIYAAKLKKVMIVGNIVVSVLVGLNFVYGGLITLNIIPVLILAILAFFSNMAREIYKTCEDVLGDKKEGVNSLAIKYGVIRAKMFGSVFVILSVAMSIVPFLLHIFSWSYLIVITIADLIFLLAMVSNIEKSAKLMKMGMMISLVAYIVGVLIV